MFKIQFVILHKKKNKLFIETVLFKIINIITCI